MNDIYLKKDEQVSQKLAHFHFTRMDICVRISMDNASSVAVVDYAQINSLWHGDDISFGQNWSR